MKQSNQINTSGATNFQTIFTATIFNSIVSPLRKGAMFDAHTFLQWIEHDFPEEFHAIADGMTNEQLADLSRETGRFLGRHNKEIEKVCMIETQNILNNDSENTLWKVL